MSPVPSRPDFGDEHAAVIVQGGVPRVAPIEPAVAAVLAGDVARFADIVRGFDARVRRIVARTLHDVHALEDVVQEVWIRVYRQLAAQRELRAVEAWIGSIARNCALDHHRACQRLPQAGLAEAVAPAASGGQVWELVEVLPVAQRDLLGWRYREGRSYAEIAGRLGVPTSTVRGRLHDARLALRRLLERTSAT